MRLIFLKSDILTGNLSSYNLTHSVSIIVNTNAGNDDATSYTSNCSYDNRDKYMFMTGLLDNWERYMEYE